jgi:hypothetical protein
MWKSFLCTPSVYQTFRLAYLVVVVEASPENQMLTQLCHGFVLHSLRQEETVLSGEPHAMMFESGMDQRAALGLWATRP